MKYDLKKSTEHPLWWVLTDTEAGLVCRFKEGEFHNTQKYTYLDDLKEVDANKIASDARGMAEWLIDNHYEIMISSPQQIKQKAREEVGLMLRNRRNELGYTVRDIEFLTGIAYNHVSRIEQGKYNVSLDTLAMIAHALDMEIDFIMPD